MTFRSQFLGLACTASLALAACSGDDSGGEDTAGNTTGGDTGTADDTR